MSAHDAAIQKFSSYVQETAFNLQLSAAMIAGLRSLRDSGATAGRRRPVQTDAIVTAATPLERRGLIYFDFAKKAPDTHQYYKLSAAGKLVCQLLVEAGIIPVRHMP